MPNPHWLPILAFALVFTVAAGVLGFWWLGWLQHPRDDASGRPPVGECAPMGSAGKPISPECPQPRPPTVRTPDAPLASLAATALVAILAVIGVGLWKFDVLRTARVENGGRPAIPACDPANAVGKAVLPECPQNAFPNPRSP